LLVSSTNVPILPENGVEDVAGLIPCWSGKVPSVAFAIDCHDREVLAYIASPRSLTGAHIRTLMDRALWARFGEAPLKAPSTIP
jgi:transposase InsO family protein